MPIEINEPYLLLAEGSADKKLVQELTKVRALPHFSTLPDKDYSGAGSFSNGLRAARGSGRAFAKLRGVLIVADSGSDPSVTLSSIQKQIGRVDGYPVPASLSTVARAPDFPALMVTLLPDDSTPGALETLYVRYILEHEPCLERCLDDFLRCSSIGAMSWTTEKRDKARFNALVAAWWRDDPSRAASWVFRDLKMIDVRDPVFDDLTGRIDRFCQSV